MVTARGIICPSQTEGKCQLETLLLLCFSVWIIIWTTDNLAHLTALTNESPNQLMHSAFSEMKKRRKHVKMSPDLKCVPAAATFSSVILCCGDELCQLSLLCNLIGTQRSIISDVHFPKGTNFNERLSSSLCCLSETFSVISVPFNKRLWISLRLLLNAAVFQRLSMWQFVCYFPSNAPLHVLFTSSLRSSSHRPQLYFSHLAHLSCWQSITSANSSQMAKVLTLNRQEIRNLEMIIWALLFY